jgi:broad specificity phosphatase PhoE
LCARETAKIVQNAFDLPDSAVVVDDRLREMGVGIYDGKTVASNGARTLVIWETRLNTCLRVQKLLPRSANACGEFLFDIERRYRVKIFFVTHELPRVAHEHGC